MIAHQVSYVRLLKGTDTSQHLAVIAQSKNHKQIIIIAWRHEVIYWWRLAPNGFLNALRRAIYLVLFKYDCQKYQKMSIKREIDAKSGIFIEDFFCKNPPPTIYVTVGTLLGKGT